LEIAMGKYEPLGQFLKKQKRNRISMTFAEIEKLIGKPLPASKRNRAFWSNNTDNNVMTRAWVDAGFETSEVEPKTGKLVFSRKESRRKKTGRQHSIFGRFKGMITLPPQHDDILSPYSAEEWDEIEKEWLEGWDNMMKRASA
jgi:hypothetical protein